MLFVCESQTDGGRYKGDGNQDLLNYFIVLIIHRETLARCSRPQLIDNVEEKSSSSQNIKQLKILKHYSGILRLT